MNVLQPHAMSDLEDGQEQLGQYNENQITGPNVVWWSKPFDG